MSRTCWSFWWLLEHRNGSPLAFMLVFVLGRRVRAFIRGFLGLNWPYTPFTRSPHIYFIVVYVFRSTDDVSLSLIPLVHVVDQEETGYGGGHRFLVSSPLSWGMGDTYAVCGASMCPWDIRGGGLEPIGVLPSSPQ